MGVQKVLTVIIAKFPNELGVCFFPLLQLAPVALCR